jgi:anthranilate phosphoribosyltransferase
VTSACDSADILEALGIAIDLGPELVARSVEEVGFGFMFAPLYHPGMRHAVAPRREIGVRTVFNILGPLTNPAGATRQLTGVAVPEIGATVAQVLGLLGTERALVVHGRDGLDEISISAPTTAYLLERGDVKELEISPEQFGLESAPRDAVSGGSVGENLDFVKSVLDGQRSPARDVVRLNAGAALYVAGLADDIQSGVDQVADLIDSGRVKEHLYRVQAISERLQAEQSARGTT